MACISINHPSDKAGAFGQNSKNFRYVFEPWVALFVAVLVKMVHNRLPKSSYVCHVGKEIQVEDIMVTGVFSNASGVQPSDKHPCLRSIQLECDVVRASFGESAFEERGVIGRKVAEQVSVNDGMEASSSAAIEHLGSCSDNVAKGIGAPDVIFGIGIGCHVYFLIQVISGC